LLNAHLADLNTPSNASVWIDYICKDCFCEIRELNLFYDL